jgi:hypothetical protein
MALTNDAPCLKQSLLRLEDLGVIRCRQPAGQVVTRQLVASVVQNTTGLSAGVCARALLADVAPQRLVMWQVLTGQGSNQKR